MARKIFDLAVKTGSYTNSQGETKGRYQNVGALMQGDDGGQFIMLASWFNPAGIPRKDGSESVLISCFAPKDNQSAPPQQQQRQQQAAPTQKFDDFEDSIPF